MTPSISSRAPVSTRGRTAFLAWACASAAACGSGQPAVESTRGSDTTLSAIDTASVAPTDTAAIGAVPATCEDLHETILKVAPTRSAFAAEFGQPDSINRSVEPNRHVPDAVDSLFTVHYPGLVMDIRAPEGARDMATGVLVRDNRYLAYPGIGIGTPATRVEQVLGEPGHRDSGELTYQCSVHVEQPVTFTVVDGRVRSIRISYYVD